MTQRQVNFVRSVLLMLSGLALVWLGEVLFGSALVALGSYFGVSASRASEEGTHLRKVGYVFLMLALGLVIAALSRLFV